MIYSLLKDALTSSDKRSAVAMKAALSQTRHLYIELMKRSLMNYIHDDDVDLMKGTVKEISSTGRLKFSSTQIASANDKYVGAIWPSRAHTMIGMPRLNDLHECIVDVLENEIEGDLIETGVWRGGATIFMRAVLKAYNVTNRIVWVADSFEGLPEADGNKHPYDSELRLHLAEDLAVSIEQVRNNFARYELLDEQVKFLKGWFRDSLPIAPIEKLSILRLDGDHYESTMDALTSLYPKLSVGGYLIIDDYNICEGCNLAIDAYRAKHNITDKIHVLPVAGAHWQRASR